MNRRYLRKTRTPHWRSGLRSFCRMLNPRWSPELGAIADVVLQWNEIAVNTGIANAVGRPQVGRDHRPAGGLRGGERDHRQVPALSRDVLTAGRSPEAAAWPRPQGVAPTSLRVRPRSMRRTGVTAPFRAARRRTTASRWAKRWPMQSSSCAHDGSVPRRRRSQARPCLASTRRPRAA